MSEGRATARTLPVALAVLQSAIDKDLPYVEVTNAEARLLLEAAALDVDVLADIRLLCDLVLGATSYLPHREAAKRVYRAILAGEKPGTP